MPTLFEKAKGWGGAVFAIVCVVNLASAGVWGVYTYAIPTPAEQQLATTNADMVGIWAGGQLRLEIKGDASVSVNQGRTHYGGKIWRLHDRDFTLWVFPVFPAHFHIEKPSAEDELVVDGITLRRERR